jgi:Iron-containing redox enzyme
MTSTYALHTDDVLQPMLARFNRARLTPHDDHDDWRRRIAEETRMRILEGEFVERERAHVADDARAVPRDPDAFVGWFASLVTDGPGQNDPLFPWLADEATFADMRWFLTQELAGEAGFDDLVALTQVKLDGRPKLELARNYWDEMGQGHAGGMHGPLLSRLAEELDIHDSDHGVVPESLALGNLMVALAANRRFAFQSIGALGAIELTAPGRAALVNRGLKRVGVEGAARRYFALHATLDRQHSEAWNREVLWPLVAEDARRAPAIAEGALLRLRAGQRCFERYRAELWGVVWDGAADMRQ